MKVALYARVSDPTGKRQTTENQVIELREHAAAAGWEIVREYIDNDTGSKESRAQFQAMMKAAANPRRGWGMVFVWSLDRFSREGVQETFAHLKRLDDAGVRFRSLKEEYLDTTGIFRDVIIAIMATLAKQERLRLVERTKAGQARARAQGVQFGPKEKRVDLKAARAMQAQGMSLREIGVVLGVSGATVLRRLNGPPPF